ncbi:MAG: hypothetical protein M1814_006301 [Vezdaea aestivalis]|nr:MAG: hypothetical protein M1814_006301 [Vezdaea aestivalis]
MTATSFCVVPIRRSRLFRPARSTPLVLSTILRPYALPQSPLSEFRPRQNHLFVPLYPCLRSPPPSQQLRHFASGREGPRRPSGFRPAQRPPPSSKAPQSFCPLHPPDDYDPDVGLPFRASPLSRSEIAKAFPSVRAAASEPNLVNSLLCIQHGRRVAGLVQNTDIKWDENQMRRLGKDFPELLLSWLRREVVMDEEAAVRRMMQAQSKEEAITLNSPERSTVDGGVYGDSVFDQIRKENEKKAEEKKRNREEQDQKDRLEGRRGNIGLIKTTQRAFEIARARPMSENMERYMANATITGLESPPELTAWARLGPSVIFTLAVSGLSLALAVTYTPLEGLARLLPDVPPAAATLIAISALNAIVYLSWKIAPIWRIMNKYFLLVPGWPTPSSLLLSTFSHISLSHMVLNIFVLWFSGVRFHDATDRGTFLATLAATGVWSSLASVVATTLYPVRAKICSVGASGAVLGIIGAYLALQWDVDQKFWGAPEGWWTFKSWMLLSLLVVWESRSIPAAMKALDALRIDSVVHVGGLCFGALIGFGIRLKRAYWDSTRERHEKM